MGRPWKQGLPLHFELIISNTALYYNKKVESNDETSIFDNRQAIFYRTFF